MATYDIRPEDHPLIDTAVQFGEWLGCQPEVTEEQQRAIAQMLAFLRNLPAPEPAGLVGEFGFEFRLNDPAWAGAHCGSWCVSVCRGMFEIFSCGHPELEDFFWETQLGWPNSSDLAGLERWIAQVKKPRSLALPHCSFVIQASASRVEDCRAHLSAAELLALLETVCPAFRRHWESPANLVSGEFSVHEVCLEFCSFYIDYAGSHPPHLAERLFFEVERIVAADPNDEDDAANALCTCFLEPLAGFLAGERSKQFMGAETLKYFSERHDAAR